MTPESRVSRVVLAHGLTLIRLAGVECEYKDAKAKPGMKPGTIEGIQRRLGRLEQAFEQHGSLSVAPEEAGLAPTGGPGEGPSAGAPPQGLGASASNDLQNLLALFVTELQKASASHPPTATAAGAAARHKGTSGVDHVEQENYSWPRSPKKRRLDRSLNHGGVLGTTNSPAASPRFHDGLLPTLPRGPALEAMIRTYFTHIHPWIPMIQEKRFRDRLSDPHDRPKLDLILYAMLVSTASFCEDLQDYETRQIEQSRAWIVSSGIGAFSVEALQALTIVAFIDVSLLVVRRKNPRC